MLICKYVDDSGLDILQNFRLRASNPMDFNDPFEIYPVIESKHIPPLLSDEEFINERAKIAVESGKFDSEEAFKKALKENREIISPDMKLNLTNSLGEYIKRIRARAVDYFRVICFCELVRILPDQDILMWSHYGKGHKGLRIHFESDLLVQSGEAIEEVRYKKKPVYFPVHHFMKKNSRVKAYEQLRRSSYTKSKAWSYEHEIRLFVSPQNCFADKENYCWRILPESIKRIDFGVESDGLVEMAAELKATYNMLDLELWQCRLGQNRFAITYERIS